MNKIILITPFLLVSINSCQKQNMVRDYAVLTMEPFYTEASGASEADAYPLPSGFNNYADLIKGAGDALASKFDNISYLENQAFKNVNYTHELVGQFGSNQIIIIEGHGSCVWEQNEARSVIWNNEYYDNTKKDSEYDYIENLIVDAEGHEGITSDYIDEYCSNNLDNSIVYLNCCFSGRDSTLAKFFLDKGASAVIGNTCTITVQYGNLMEYTTIKLLGEINPNTKNLYTIYDALEKAKELYGRSDNSTGAEPILFGNPYFSLAK